jgi:molybdopterin-guanine dinucleotide biosynthesis protein A
MTANTPKICAIVLAGGRVPPTLVEYCSQRALLRISGRFMLDYLLETLNNAPSIAGFVLVAAPEALPELAHLPGRKLAASDTLVDNMQRGAREVAGANPTHLLFVTGDIPLLTVAGIEEYIAASVASGAALTYPIIPRSASEQRFPGATRTYVRLKEDNFTGGNAIFTTAHLLDDKRELIQRLYTARKDPFKLAQILGLATVLRMLLGILTLPYVERVASRLLGAPARAIITRHAEIGFDVDKASDLRAVETALGASLIEN